MDIDKLERRANTYSRIGIYGLFADVLLIIALAIVFMARGEAILLEKITSFGTIVGGLVVAIGGIATGLLLYSTIVLQNLALEAQKNDAKQRDKDTKEQLMLLQRQVDESTILQMTKSLGDYIDANRCQIEDFHDTLQWVIIDYSKSKKNNEQAKDEIDKKLKKLKPTLERFFNEWYSLVVYIDIHIKDKNHNRELTLFGEAKLRTHEKLALLGYYFCILEFTKTENKSIFNDIEKKMNGCDGEFMDGLKEIFRYEKH